MSRLTTMIALAAACAACGGSSAGGRSTTAIARSADAANVAAQATEPRTNDPTARPAASPAPANVDPPAAPANVARTGDDVGNEGAPAQGPAVDTTPKKISARHVLVQWMGSDRAGKSVLRTKEQAQVLAQEVLKRAKAGDDIGRLAVEYSDEPNAGARGGSLGRFGRGQMVGAFEQVAFKLRVGEISDIVETPFGYHIIQRTE